MDLYLNPAPTAMTPGITRWWIAVWEIIMTLKNLSVSSHESGIKVVVDGVFNHTGREFFAFKDIQEKKSGPPL